MPDELWTEVRDTVQETGIKTIPMEKKYKKAKMGVQVSFSIWHSDIGIPNYIKKLSGIVKIWSSELHVAF